MPEAPEHNADTPIPSEVPAPQAATRWRRFLGPMIGLAVLVYLLGFQIDLHDQRISGVLQSVDSESRTATVLLSSGKTAGADWSAVEEFQLPPASSGFQNTEASAIGSTVTIVRHGILHYAGRLSAATIASIFGLLFTVLLLQAWRFQLLFRGVGGQITLFTSLRGLLVGLFYGNVIPAGQVGGDPVKALLIAKWSGSTKAAAFAATLMDRAIGLMCLLLLAVGALLARGWNEQFQRYAWIILGLTAVGLICFGLVLSRRVRRRSGVTSVLKRLPFGDKLSSVSEAIGGFQRHPGVMLLVAALSFASQFLLVTVVYAIGQSIAVVLPYIDYVILVPVANVVASLPLSPPGGWGIGEGAFVLLFGAVGVGAEPAFTLSFVARFSMVLVSLLGFFALLKGKTDAPAPSNSPIKERA